MIHLLLPDTWHFHRRNFAALFDAFAAGRIRVIRERSRWRWWKAHGDYRALEDQLSTHLAMLQPLGVEDLLALEAGGINLWRLARSEFLCLVLARPRWLEGGYDNGLEAVLRRAWDHPQDRADLLLCMAAARDWVDFWNQRLTERPQITHTLVFSGSYIYTQALQAVSRQRGLRCFGLESFFTGREFYFEERTDPLSNNSKLREPAWVEGLALPDRLEMRYLLRAEALRRLKDMRNKNVRAIRRPVVPFWRDGRPVVLVVGQVLNDFSLIETPMAEASSIAVYKELIGRLLTETDANVIFKAHPWERRRPNLKGPVTLKALESFAAQLTPDRRARLMLLEHEAIGELFPMVDHVAGLCSQGLLEAAQAGLKPIQLGNAFFGRQGFTHDMGSVAEYLAAFAELNGSLSLTEYDRFQDFLVRALLIHLVRNDANGAASVALRLAEPNHMPACPDPTNFRYERPVRTSLLLYDMAANPLVWLRDLGGWLAARCKL